MTPSGAALGAGLSAGAALWLAGRRPAVDRLRRALSRPRAGRPGRVGRAGWSQVPGPLRRVVGVTGALVVLAGAAGLAGVAGVVVAGPAVGLPALRAGRARAQAARERRACDAALPRVADLLAACVAVGVPPAEALDGVRQAVGGPIADRLAPVVSALRLGSDPVQAYRAAAPYVPEPDLTLALVRVLEGAVARGVPLVEAAGRVADDARRRRRWTAEAAARRAGVLAVGPLMVCHLPAFVLIGVVPLVVGVARAALGDLG